MTYPLNDPDRYIEFVRRCLDAYLEQQAARDDN